MSLPQLIGHQCVTCQKSIASVIDGVFCEACGNPVHKRCVGAAQAAADKCSQCGGDGASEVAKEVRRIRGMQSQAEQRAQSAGIGGAPIAFPVSVLCPQCGHHEYTAQRPQSWVSFTWDRVCKQCGCIYTPPTPRWAAIVFIVAGLLLSGFGFLSVAAHLSSGNPLGVPAMVCEGFLGVLGVLSIIQGIRSLSTPGKV